jgi:NADH-quinone oxidoreductase subunit D
MFEEVGTTTEGDLIINVGPQHPATHGVLHLVITLNGETIKNVYLCYESHGLFIGSYQ